MTLPDPPGAGPTSPDGTGRLPVGLPIEFTDPNGALHQLIQRAKDNGRTHLTLVVAMALNGHQNTTLETLQTTPNNMLNFLYSVNPKEVDSDIATSGFQLNNDIGWDPDASGPLARPAALILASTMRIVGPIRSAWATTPMAGSRPL